MSTVALMTSTNLADTMTSKELLDLINEERKLFGESEVRHNQFVDRCKDELDGDHYKNFVVTNSNNTESEVLELNLDQCMLVSMRESKGVRRSVQAKLKAKQAPALPANYVEALRVLADKVEETQRIEAQRDEAIRTKAQIGSKREASAMAKASAATREANRLKEELGFNSHHATIKAVRKATDIDYSKDWRKLKAWCTKNGVSAVAVPDQTYGEVQAWPAGAWMAVFGIDLREIFPAAAMEAA